MMNKKRINKRLLPLLLGGLLLTACSNENIWSYDGGKADDNEYVDVNFSVNSQGELLTRATTDGDGNYVPTIAQGKLVDELIYAVYEVIRNESDEKRPITAYNLLAQYGNENGQIIVSNPFAEENDGKYETKLRLMRNKEYAIAFWAQKSETQAYNTSDLKNVIVNYQNAKNNDELRDAFCKVEMFTVSANQTINVILQRPLAQINAGTTGADYYNHLYSYRQRPVLKSSITLKGVANCINVVTDEISSTDDFSKEVTFWANKIAAYWDVTDLPSDLDEILGSDDPTTAKNNTEAAEEGSSDESSDEITGAYLAGEEFLMINLDGHSKEKPHAKNKDDDTDKANSMGFLKYKTEYPTLNGDGTFKTETFKYISMCYVLVPASINPDKKGETVDQYYSSVLKNVTFTMENDAEDADHWARKISVDNVPVHRNWRTNILGGLSKGTTNRPEDPDDPSSFFEGQVSVDIYLDPIFEGEYNSTDEGTTWKEDNYGKTNSDQKTE